MNKKDSEEHYIAEDNGEYRKEDGSAEQRLLALRKELAQCRKDKEEYLLGWQRCKADAANARTELDRQRTEFSAFAAKDIITELTGILTTFHNAFTGADESNPYVQGFRHIYAQLLSLLEQRGLEILPARNMPFDASLHEAIDMVPVAKKEDDGMIVEVIEEGYTLHKTVIRPARVKVGEFKKTA